MKLIIAEKPSVAKSIAVVVSATKKQSGYFEGDTHLVSWCLGHLVELFPPDKYDPKYEKWTMQTLPILPDPWQYQVLQRSKAQFAVLQNLMRRNDVESIIEATDAGREGELIFRLVYHKVGCTKPFSRLWISSLEESAIQKGLDNLQPSAAYDALYAEALARSKADWLVGFNMTRLLTLRNGVKHRVGRVVTPTLAMIVARDVEIAAFRVTPFYTVQLDLGEFTVSGQRMLDKQAAEAIAQSCHGQDCVVSDVDYTEKTENPPKLYDLTTLQRDANKQLGFTAAQTLEYAQSLYEKKLLTYPRTDSRFLTEDMAQTVHDTVALAASLFLPDHIAYTVTPAQVIDNKKVSDHHAIVPTAKATAEKLEALPYGERQLLLLVATRLVCAVASPRKYALTVITATCNNHVFVAKGTTTLQAGWRDVQQAGAPAKENASETLPETVQGEVFTAKAYVKEGKTTPPKHYTDDTLLAAMENANHAEVDTDYKGIGTPATRANTIEKLVAEKYIERKAEKKGLHYEATEDGRALITAAPESIKSPLLTAEWEEKLAEIEAGSLSADAFLQEVIDTITHLVNTYQPPEGASVLFPKKQTIVGTCPRCGKNIVEFSMKTGGKVYPCESGKTEDGGCGFVLFEENKFFKAQKKKLTSQMVKTLLMDGKVKVCGLYSAKKDKTYDATIALEDTGKWVNFKFAD